MTIENISNVLKEAGITENQPGWGTQFNLLLASMSEFGVRHGLDHRVVLILEREMPELFTPEAKIQQAMDFIAMLEAITRL